jgi:uncharacterized membrane protein YGL010W
MEQAMRTADVWFEMYGESHQNKINKAIHWVCIPLITWSLLALLQVLPTPFIEVALLNWGALFVVVALVFYGTLSWTIMGGMGLIAAALLVANEAALNAGLPLGWIALAVFAISWLAQFIGHWIEGEKPSFFEDLQFLLVGPAWLLQFVYRKVGVPVNLAKTP